MRSLPEPSGSFFPSREEFVTLLTVLLVACAVAFGCSFLANHLGSNPKSFCDSNLDSIDSDLDLCEPCPINGECYQGKLQCNHGYRKQGNLCIEDGEINESTKKLVGHFERKVCEAYAHNECYGTGETWVSENDVWKDLRINGFVKNLDEAAYNFVKAKAGGAVADLLEKRTNSNGINELKCPELLMASYKPMTCRINQWLLQHIFIISSSCVMLVAFAVLRRKIQRKRQFSNRVEELYDQVCDFLEENAMTSNSAENSNNCEPWVIASRLRDHLLLPRERRDPLLWSMVEKLIQEDSRIDRYPKIIKGEQKVVWEWQVEGSLSLSKLKKRGHMQKKFRQVHYSRTMQENYNRGIAETSS
ncbi:unnamed protein product [Thlaspi arvense]|uniref:Man1/Src1-like C-terminal domain-containing protein n=1 Tax=Thlaspi arvense TaxID=13288 RepID=A0AAU9RSI6_THLAR|nr:unnamed protein product [Thlaspi arvense]